MTFRRLAWVGGLLVLVVSGVYVFVYLYRWEWNRALVCAAVFLATEVALVGGAILERLGRIASTLERLSPSERETIEHLRDAAPPPRRHFAWLRETGDGLGVFVPILMAAGIVASALAWLVEHLARATAGSVVDRRLARRLADLAWPDDGLLDPGDPP